MGRTELRRLAVALCLAILAGCSAPAPEPAKQSAPPKLPPGQKFGYQPPTTGGTQK